MIVAPAHVIEMLQPELDGIGAGGDREFIHEALDRKHVVIGAKRAHRRNAQRHRFDEMMHHLCVREFVDRNGVAIAAALRQRKRLRRGQRERLRHMLGGQHRPRAARPHRMRVAPDVEVPVDDRAVAVERSFQAWSPSPGRTAPRRAPVRASTARERASRATRARPARRRPRHRRRHYGRSIRILRHGSAGRWRAARAASPRCPGDPDRRPGYGSRPS